jgi:hypothetical protein
MFRSPTRYAPFAIAIAVYFAICTLPDPLITLFGSDEMRVWFYGIVREHRTAFGAIQLSGFLPTMALAVLLTKESRKRRASAV